MDHFNLTFKQKEKEQRTPTEAPFEKILSDRESQQREGLASSSLENQICPQPDKTLGPSPEEA
jgi:hypothetical protein